MAIFDIEKDDLLKLSEVELEELIALLAEAEIATHGYSPAYVHWSGSISAPDGGVDIRVQVPADTLSIGFLKRPDTIFQVKKSKMGPAAIKKEMKTKSGEELLPSISEQAIKGGSYIIVSLEDDCSPPMKEDRLQAMQDAVSTGNIHLDFYDRSKLAQWLRQHPSVMLWVKRNLGQEHTGWKPYGAWSNPPMGDTDHLIVAQGVTVTLPRGFGQKFNIKDAINSMRELVRSTNKAVRIIGLSGVGKTRIVQALFDENNERVGTDALDRTIAIYVDTGDNPNPSVTAMLERLIGEKRRAIMVVDNCPADLHSSLAAKVLAASGEVKLITVEYDIRDDKPQSTEVVHIEATGPEIAKRLLMRRFPNIGQKNARRIAKFADGNARVALAIAERVEDGESLAQLSDEALFDRLFEQRKQSNGNLREQAEILSLVYSFSISKSENGCDELKILSSLSKFSRNQFFRSVNTLLERHIMQKRGDWRAILPHAIANRLTKSALNSIPVEQLREVFEKPGRERLLMSFAHRLGMMHDHSRAKEIVEAWLQPDGLLGRITELDDISLRMLDYIAPVEPKLLLKRIEEELERIGFIKVESSKKPQWRVIANLLQLLAYEPSAFERCIRLLIRMADYEDEDNNYNNYHTIRGKITIFYQAYLSGTHASLEQRIAILEECLGSDMAKRKTLGLNMLSNALRGLQWTSADMQEFGARPRDLGIQPTDNEFVKWLSTFIDIAVRLGTSGDLEVQKFARQLLADRFPELWEHEAMQEKLSDAARKLHDCHPWNEGWRAVRSIIFDYCRYKNGDESQFSRLVALDKELEPRDLIPTIMAYVLVENDNLWELTDNFDDEDPNKHEKAAKQLKDKAVQLGLDFAVSSHKLCELGPSLFSSLSRSHRTAFGRGLARGADDLQAYWQQLVSCLDQQQESTTNFSMFRGFIEETDSTKPVLAQEFLDQCAQHSKLSRQLVGLHPQQRFSERDLDRCMVLLDNPDIGPFMYRPILWQDRYTNLPGDRVLDLAKRLLTKPNGDDVVINALGMRLRGNNDAKDVLGKDFRLVGLQAAIQRVQKDHGVYAKGTNYYIERVIRAALYFDGNKDKKLEWLDTIFSVVNKRLGYTPSFGSAIKTTVALMPKEFLTRVFEGTEEQLNRQRFFIRHFNSQGSLFSEVNVNVLIDWCCARKDNTVWVGVASGISPWAKDEELEKVTLSETAIKFLEASPEPRAVLEIFALGIMPTSGSGSIVAMQSRADAIGRLIKHKCPEIAKAAKSVHKGLINRVEEEKKCEIFEQHRDQEREQRFE